MKSIVQNSFVRLYAPYRGGCVQVGAYKPLRVPVQVLDLRKYGLAGLRVQVRTSSRTNARVQASRTNIFPKLKL